MESVGHIRLLQLDIIGLDTSEAQDTFEKHTEYRNKSPYKHLVSCINEVTESFCFVFVFEIKSLSLSF